MGRWKNVRGELRQEISCKHEQEGFQDVSKTGDDLWLRDFGCGEETGDVAGGGGLSWVRFIVGGTNMDRIRYYFIRGTAQVDQFGNKVREERQRWFGHLQRRSSG